VLGDLVYVGYAYLCRTKFDLYLFFGLSECVCVDFEFDLGVGVGNGLGIRHFVSLVLRSVLYSNKISECSAEKIFVSVWILFFIVVECHLEFLYRW
jgi:hypothetical protein